MKVSKKEKQRSVLRKASEIFVMTIITFLAVIAILAIIFVNWDDVANSVANFFRELAPFLFGMGFTILVLVLAGIYPAYMCLKHYNQTTEQLAAARKEIARRRTVADEIVPEAVELVNQKDELSKKLEEAQSTIKSLKARLSATMEERDAYKDGNARYEDICRLVNSYEEEESEQPEAENEDISDGDDTNTEAEVDTLPDVDGETTSETEVPPAPTASDIDDIFRVFNSRKH